MLPLAGSLAQNDHVLGHELVHVFQYDIASSAAISRRPRAVASKRCRSGSWKGMAEYLSDRPVDPHTAMWIRDATEGQACRRSSDLDSREYFPYRWGQAVWAYIGGRYGDDAIARIFRDAVRRETPNRARERRQRSRTRSCRPSGTRRFAANTVRC